MQLRGNCQMCGRHHAVVRGAMAKHGYEVKNGYFAGVCSGDRYEPMQVARDMTDSLIVSIIADSEKGEARADALESGRETLGLVRKPGVLVRQGQEPIMVDWSSLPVWEARDVLASAVWNLRGRAKMGRQFAEDLGNIADRVHGKPLDEVERPTAPAPILQGERRTTEHGSMLIARYTKGARVYWATPEGRRGWTGTQAWRALPLTA